MRTRPAMTRGRRPCSARSLILIGTATRPAMPRRKRLPRPLPLRTGRIECAAVQQQVLPDNEADLRRTEEGASLAEFRRIAGPAGRGASEPLLHDLVHRAVALAGGLGEAAAQPIGQEGPGQDVVDDDVMF